MKKHLLLGIALIAAVSAFPQSNRQLIRPSRMAAVPKGFPLKTVGVNETPVSPMYGSALEPVQDESQRGAPTSVTWKLLCGSMNTYGMLVSNSRPLQYNPNLNAVSFIHRKSESYTVTPPIPIAAESGVIVAEISSNWGASWDSTCIYADPTDWGRYPQGGIYNPTGNSSISNAYVVGCGVTVGANSFSGDWYASKKLNVFSTTASTVAGAQQFISFSLPSYPPNMAAHGWSRCGFSVTDDGIVRSVATLERDYATGGGMRGYAILTGTFNGATFDWKIDSVIPYATVDNTGDKNLMIDPQMAWNQAGTIGYLVGSGQTSLNKANGGLVPIIYKMDRSTNPAATWTQMPSINFNSPAMRPIVISRNTFTSQAHFGLAGLDTIMTGPNTWDTIGAPRTEELDIAVDANGQLHIGFVCSSMPVIHPDSVNYVTQFTTQPNSSEEYRWRHVNGSRPYLWDIIGDGISPWKPLLVDSISSEGPSPSPGYPGYASNPWDAGGTGGAKVSIDARLQLGRTPDGKFITFSWSESDSLVTDDSYKWNNLPDLKVRAMAIPTIATGVYSLNVNSNPVSPISPKQNMTSMGNNTVKNRATLHYMSPITGSATVTGLGTPTAPTYTVDINTPLTVTNSNPYLQLFNNRTWYGAAAVTYLFKQPTTVGVAENANLLTESNIYPNPAKGTAMLSLVLENSEPVEIVILNTVGQSVRTTMIQGHRGEQAFKLDLSGLSSGLYFVNIKAGDAQATKKLILE
jgi:hypothetical protein